MTRLMSQLVQWGLTRKPLRTLFLLLTVVGSLAAFTCTEAVMRDIAVRSIGTWRSDPYDITVTGLNAYEQEKPITGISGVSQVERAIVFEAMIGAGMAPIAVPSTGSTLLPFEYVEGLAPGTEQEIAVTSSIANMQALKLGDKVELALRSNLDKPVTYTVSGILVHKQGLARVNVVTTQGAERLHKELSNHSTLLVLLHPSASQEVIYNAIRPLGAELTIRLYNQSFDQGFSTAEALISLTIMLVLGVSTISLYMLFYLGQQERAYELGVLRALGFSKRKVVTTLVIEGALILLAGGLASFLVLFLVATLLNMGRWDVLLAQYLPSGGLLLGLGLLVVFWTARSFASRPITALIKDR